jgi:hypothetical protein
VPTSPDRGCDVADTWTWDEAACRARLAAYKANASAHDVLQCASNLRAFAAWQEIVRHAPTDLGAALAEIDRLRAKLEEADGVIAAATSAITEQLHRAVALGRECDRLREVVRGLSERVAAQSELLCCRAEGRP